MKAIRLNRYFLLLFLSFGIWSNSHNILASEELDSATIQMMNEVALRTVQCVENKQQNNEQCPAALLEFYQKIQASKNRNNKNQATKTIALNEETPESDDLSDQDLYALLINLPIGDKEDIFDSFTIDFLNLEKNKPFTIPEAYKGSSQLHQYFRIGLFLLGNHPEYSELKNRLEICLQGDTKQIMVTLNNADQFMPPKTTERLKKTNPLTVLRCLGKRIQEKD